MKYKRPLTIYLPRNVYATDLYYKIYPNQPNSTAPMETNLTKSMYPGIDITHPEYTDLVNDYVD
eukprot:snap_masked-scaffold_7-processed-gene-9.17-mRNA-1 protein AED:1.00 eAED:1.00 QI:0/-1/0/0/-1/1/1/0/63